MALVLKVACPDCGQSHDSAVLGAALRCAKCGRDFRAAGDGEGATRILSVTPDELDHVPYSQRSVEQPVNKFSSIIPADPALLTDKLLRDAPVRENAKWLGKVRLLKKLGQGGMGAVYRGFEEALALDVAVKVVPLPPDEREQQFVERFQREARISAKINHPNVVRTFQVDREGGLLYLVMDYIAGQTARVLVEHRGPLPLPLALQIFQDVARGVHAAHQHGVIHRDIKPDNILVAEDGRVLLSDLGLAKAVSTGESASQPLTRLGLLLGTPEYMSPEQWEIGAEVGRASDIWSLGATFWLLLTGKPPFEAQDLPALARSIKAAPLPDIRLFRPDLPAHIPLILQRCLAKKPEDRFANCTELLTAIEQPGTKQAQAALSPVPAPGLPNPTLQSPSAVSQSPIPKLQAPIALPRRHAARLACAGAVLVAAAGAAWYGLKTPPAPPSAPVLSLERSVTHVKPGEEARLCADLSGTPQPSGFAIIWIAEARAYCGNEVRLTLEHDTDFFVSVRDKNTGRQTAERELQVRADLDVRAGGQDYYRLASGTPFTVEGRIEGGPRNPGEIEARWLMAPAVPGNAGVPPASVAAGAAALPETAVCATGRVLAIPVLKPGRYIFVFQAKRTSQAWAQAATDKIVAEVIETIPPEFTAALNQAAEARRNAAQAASGAEALASWRKALEALKQAATILPNAAEVKTQASDCAQQMAVDEKYAALLEEAARLKAKAEQTPPSDGLGQLAAWSEALQPCTAAVALFNRAEARTQAAAVREKLASLKAELAAAEEERAAFDTLIARTRETVKEARKLAAPAVALPYWERAAAGFEELARRFPKRADEFTLELKDAQENRDKAFLYDTLGVVPEQKTKSKK